MNFWFSAIFLQTFCSQAMFPRIPTQISCKIEQFIEFNQILNTCIYTYTVVKEQITNDNTSLYVFNNIHELHWFNFKP